ncbi:MAG: polyphosphate polymerase domain-containing protein [Gammaproteobacteria bacterium]|nr:polyphosphate polymerase domain-containing protein [Gammaproteobacteria bacterium]MBT8437789.1 polyphosphate polymerase domain-containing protein [Gammaproteobacteria bacterium]
MGILTSLPATIERHELKYAVPWRFVEPICRFIEPYCELDHHSAISADNFYLVSSLYLDTRGLEFLRQRMYGKDGRFNMRVRCYGEQGQAPYFLEIKRKRGFIGKKYRAIASEDEWPAIIQDPQFRIQPADSDKNQNNMELFYRLATSYAIEPKLLTQYRRRAYVSTIDQYARVTLDASMKYRAQNHFSLVSDENMVSYDNETIYTRDMVSDAAVVLELKCDVGQVPTWMLDLISTFDLKQQGFSKYMSSFLVSHLDDGIAYMSGDRMSRHYAYG